MVQEGETLLQKFELLKALGFDGVEPNSPNGLNREELLAARDATGLEIHGVVDSVHWQKPLSHPDPDVRKAGLNGLSTALDDANVYGASTVLLVPAVVNKSVSYGDAYRRSQQEIRKVLPKVAELGLQIALENVWNSFLLSPVEAARYIDELNEGQSRPLVGLYLDAGNLVRYGWPEHWVQECGSRILKVDVKGYSRKKQMEEGPWKGFRVEIGDGDTDWEKVAEELEKIGFDGWFTAEVGGGNKDRLADVAARMDAFMKPVK